MKEYKINIKFTGGSDSQYESFDNMVKVMLSALSIYYEGSHMKNRIEITNKIKEL